MCSIWPQEGKCHKPENALEIQIQFLRKLEKLSNGKLKTIVYKSH